jgi:Family of unknown function (DUF5709)
MTGESYDDSFEGSDQLDPSETLSGDNTEDPLEVGYSPPDYEPKATRFGTTADEEREGETLDQRLAEEEPDVSADDVAFGLEDERAGRLVSPDEGAHPDFEKDEIAHDAGRAGEASSAEEAAVHVVDEE